MPIDKRIDALVKSRLAKKENIGFDQVEKHLQRARKDLQVAQANLNIDEEASFNYAYLAMLRTARALMFSEGYRPIDGAQHKTVIEFAGIILGDQYKSTIKRYDDMRKKRNVFTYHPGIPVSKTEAEEAMKLADIWVNKISEIIHAKNPQFKLL